MRRSADVDFEMKKHELRKTASDDTSYFDDQITLLSSSPKKEQLRKEMEKSRKTTKKKGKVETLKQSETSDKTLKPTPSTDGLCFISYVNHPCLTIVCLFVYRSDTFAE